MNIKRVKDAVDKNRLSVKPMKQTFDTSLVVFYDHVPLWRTLVDLDQLDIYLYDPTEMREEGEEYEPYTLFCVDQYEDIYTFGRWETKEEALAWLKKPTTVCPVCQAVFSREDLRDEASKQEYDISGMCQDCQDEIFE